MKNAFMVGLGLGLVLGTYMFKNCPAVAQAYDNAEANIKNKVEECKDTIKRKKQQKAAATEQMPEQGF